MVERDIDGYSFIQLTREDFSIIFPSKSKFLLSSKLFKFAQRIRSITEGSSRDTASLLADMSDLECPLQSASSGLSSRSSSRCSTPFSEGRKRSMDASAVLSKRKCGESGFKLPQFSPDLKLCINEDSFYTSAQRNKLIKEGCLALRGHCWELEKSISNQDKRQLAKLLYQLAPKSLGDPDSSNPEVCCVCATYFVPV